ncbi:MAG: hypothetical protein JWR26_2194 [Pedosphaera sp.]|nr:hypothetical protein [Pedosphaera sp.]
MTAYRQEIVFRPYGLCLMVRPRKCGFDEGQDFSDHLPRLVHPNTQALRSDPQLSTKHSLVIDGGMRVPVLPPDTGIIPIQLSQFHTRPMLNNIALCLVLGRPCQITNLSLVGLK